MKHFFKIAIVAIALTTTAFTANAQYKGDMAAGVKAAVAADSGRTFLGLGAKFQYNVTDPLRLEAEFTYFLPKSETISGVKMNYNMWDFSVNAHWLFRVAEKVNVYPVAGLGVLGAKTKTKAAGVSVSGGTSQFAFNLGGGADFFLSEKMFINVEAKYMIADGGCFMPSAGVGFMF